MSDVRRFRSALVSALGLVGEDAAVFETRVNRQLTSITVPAFLRDCTGSLGVGDGVFYPAIKDVFKIWGIEPGVSLQKIAIPPSIRFRDLRHKFGLTLSQSAQILNTDARTIRKWEAVRGESAREPNPIAIRVFEWIDAEIIDLAVILDKHCQKD